MILYHWSFFALTMSIFVCFCLFLYVCVFLTFKGGEATADSRFNEIIILFIMKEVS